MTLLKCAFTTGLSLDGRKLTGSAVPYSKVGYPSDGVPTIIRPGAFGTIGDVVANVAHDPARVIARTEGGSMVLTDSPTELLFAAELPETREADDVLALVKAGILRGLSIEANAPGAAMVKGVRIVTAATLTGLAVVARPGFKETSVQVAAVKGDARAAVAWYLL